MEPFSDTSVDSKISTPIEITTSPIATSAGVAQQLYLSLGEDLLL
jgi:hypothetical protein